MEPSKTTAATYKGLTASDLSQLDDQQLMQLYLSLESPKLSDMQGEFSGQWLAKNAPWFSKFTWKLAAYNNWSNGYWLGKSFQLLSDTHGWGFNNLKKFGGLVRRWPMHISIGKSRYDEKNSFCLNYRHYYSFCGLLGVEDEFRKLDEKNLLGLAHYRTFFGLSIRPMWFIMSGPIADFDSSGHLLK